jgi:plasmid stabilization system protein ParE
MMPVEVHPEASAEVSDSASWYEARTTGLGAAYLDQVQAALRCVAESPLAFGFLKTPWRIHRVHRFPYGVVYRVASDRVFVIAVMHLHRRPDYWASRAAS